MRSTVRPNIRSSVFGAQWANMADVVLPCERSRPMDHGSKNVLSVKHVFLQSYRAKHPDGDTRYSIADGKAREGSIHAMESVNLMLFQDQRVGPTDKPSANCPPRSVHNKLRYTVPSYREAHGEKTLTCEYFARSHVLP